MTSLHQRYGGGSLPRPHLRPSLMSREGLDQAKVLLTVEACSHVAAPVIENKGNRKGPDRRHSLTICTTREISVTGNVWEVFCNIKVAMWVA